MLLSILLVATLQTSFSIGQIVVAQPEDTGLPAAYLIEGVPFHKQYTGQSCGYACLEMVFDYYGEDIPQQEIIAVEGRFSELPGYTVGFVREAHFSEVSTSIGLYHGSNIIGYDERGLGYASFRYSSETPWLDRLKALIAQDYPVMVNQWMEIGEEWPHWRLVIGYDDVSNEMIVHDPWDRGNTGLTENMKISYEDFCELWTYDLDFGLPYTATLVVPWSVSIDAPSSVDADSSFTATATIGYPCPEPFDNSQYPASNAEATLSLPEGLSLADGESAAKNIGDLSAGGEVIVSWEVVATGGSGSYSLFVQSHGTITGLDAHSSVYSDLIGGKAGKTLVVV